MEVLDASIANVALRNIAGKPGSRRRREHLVLTSYLVANSVILQSAAGSRG